jgi:hypothetical protein
MGVICEMAYKAVADFDAKSSYFDTYRHKAAAVEIKTSPRALGN